MVAKTHDARVLRLELDATQRLCENIASPRAIMVWMLIEHREFDQLVSLSINPRDYLNHQHFADDYLVTSVLSKNPRLPTGFDREANARQKFWAAEDSCKRANERIRSMNDGILPSQDIVSCLSLAQGYIRKILGPLSKRRINSIEGRMRFGPGATTSLRGIVTQGKKYSSRPIETTPRASHYRIFCFPENWKQFSKEISLRKSSKMRIVPKNAKTDRVICIEPDLNIFLQLGVGAEIKALLCNFGLDLHTQEWNQILAQMAWTHDLCTMDLSGASDCVCTEAVWYLLPFDWADMLYFSRTDFVDDGEAEHELQKWSSMGNGYTFELETLLFYGIILGACEQNKVSSTLTSAYGDDLIFPNEVRDLVQRTLEFLGFSVNVEKTFGKGTFHESCGSDWFEGMSVRPIFFRTQHHDFQTVCYILGNSLSSWASRNLYGVARDIRVLPAWLRCYTACPASDRHRIPSGYGDVGFVSSFDEGTPSKVERCRPYGRRGGYFTGYLFPYRRIRSVTKRVSEEGMLLASLNRSGTPWSLGKEALRGRFEPAATKLGLSLDWPFVGPWL